MQDSVIRCAVEGPLARISIDRPHKRNALATGHWASIEACLDTLVASPEVQVVVLRGVPGAFSAGADIDELGRMLAQPENYAQSNAIVQRTQLKLQRMPQTTLAVIDGPCVGGGLGLALACDMRLASARARFAITPAKLGLVYSADDSRRLVNTVGMARARELLLTGRMLDAGDAEQWGLVNRVVPVDSLEDAERELLDRLLTTSGQARRGIKTVLAHLGGDPEASAAQAATAFDAAFSSADFAEGARAFLDKRPPRFR